MLFDEFEGLFAAALQRNGISPLSREQNESFFAFTQYFTEVNAHTNLTAIRDVADIIDKHYVDCLAVSEQIPNGASILDLGCGPGFPSIPLAIARRDLSIVALDSTDKKIRFLKESIAILKLSNLTAVCGRAEDAEIRKQIGQKEVVVSRAVAKMSVLSELCLPYVTVGGKLIAMKGAKADDELEEAKNGIRILGGGEPIVISSELRLHCNANEKRAFVVVPKQKPTPAAYPRAYAAILKKPLS